MSKPELILIADDQKLLALTKSKIEFDKDLLIQAAGIAVLFASKLNPIALVVSTAATAAWAALGSAKKSPKQVDADISTLRGPLLKAI